MLPKPEDRRILAALRDLHKELRSLVSLLDPVQQRVDAIGSDNPSAYEHTKPQSQATVTTITQWTNAEAIQEEAHHQQGYGFQRKMLVVQWLLFGATMLAFGAAAWYAHVATLQKGVMDKQLQTMNHTFEEAQKQTVSAEIAAKATSEQARIIRQQIRGNYAADWPSLSALGLIKI